MSHKTAAEIQTRFLDEQANIRRFIVTADEYTQINDDAAKHVTYLLNMNGVTQFFQRPPERKGQPFDASEVAALLAIIDQLEPKLKDLAQQQDQQIDAFEADTFANSIPPEKFELFGDWLQYIDANLSGSPTIEEREALVERSFHKHIEALEEGYPLERTEEDDEHIRGVIRHAITQVECRRLTGRNNALRRALDFFERMRFAARLTLPEAEVNLYRQGFLLLMTAFDAAVFDIVRVALRNDFLKLIARFGRSDKVALTEFADYDDLDQFQDAIIERQLKLFYIKDVLQILNHTGVVLADPAIPNAFAQVVEFVIRRNVHVHNRGYVDQRYLDSNVNVYNLALGQLAAIDVPYLENANKLCADCIARLTSWATR